MSADDMTPRGNGEAPKAVAEATARRMVAEYQNARCPMCGRLRGQATPWTDLLVIGMPCFHPFHKGGS